MICHHQTNDNLVNYQGNLNDWTIFHQKPNKNDTRFMSTSGFFFWIGSFQNENFLFYFQKKFKKDHDKKTHFEKNCIYEMMKGS